jgi:hypothetical protein
MIGRLQQLSATGDIVATAEVTLLAVVLSPAAANASAIVREGGSGGTVVLTLNAVANGSSVVIPGPIAIRGPHLTLSGAGALFHVVK